MLRRVHFPKPPMVIYADAAFTLEPAAGTGTRRSDVYTYAAVLTSVRRPSAFMRAPTKGAHT